MIRIPTHFIFITIHYNIENEEKLVNKHILC